MRKLSVKACLLDYSDSTQKTLTTTRMGGLESHSGLMRLSQGGFLKLLKETTMQSFTYFTLSVEKGIRGNIGKLPIFKGEGDKVYADMMLFLVPNGNEPGDQHTQIVNVHFQKALFEGLKAFNLGDYIQIGFDRIDISKGISEKTNELVTYIAVKANSIKLVRKAAKEVQAS